MWRGRFFEAPARRTICVETLKEETHDGDDVGLLLQSLYGTRGASESSGSRKSLRWFRQDISLSVVGDGREEVQETKVLNRIIRMDHEGWHYKADQRHGELIVMALNLQEAKSVQTPGEDGRRRRLTASAWTIRTRASAGRWRRGPTTSPSTGRTSSTRPKQEDEQPHSR